MVHPGSKEPQENFSAEEAEKRLKAALRGARIAGPKPMKDKPAVKKSKSEKKPGK